MSTNRILCTYARRGGEAPHFCIVHIGDEHENVGECAICNLEPAQEWIKGLNPGDPVYVRTPIRRSRQTDQLMCDASPNAFQPCYSRPEPQPPASKPKAVPSPEETVSFRRIDTYLERPEDIKIFKALADHCANKHAANLLLTYGIKCLPPFLQDKSGEDVYAWLTK